MTDVTQGQDANTDNDLFNEATTAETLTDFENPKPLETELPDPTKKEIEPKADAPKPHPATEDNAPVPSGRFREESAARRKAEQERDELFRQLEHARRQPQAPPQLEQPPKPVDMFENPQGFVEQAIAPYLEQVRDDLQKQREAMSLNYAVDRHGGPTVSTARQRLEEGMSRGDPNAWGTYNRAMRSQDPYGVIVRAHMEAEQLREIGGDLEGYKQRIREEALQDPEYRKRVIETLRSQANGGTQVFRPAGSQQQKAPAPSPSLGDIGASGGEITPVEPNDEELFRAATRAKRR